MTTTTTLSSNSPATRCGAVLIVIHAFMISVGLVLIAGMLAAAAFAGGLTITFPLVATFHGFSETGNSPAMTMTGSWVGAVVLAAALTTGLSLLTFRLARVRAVLRSES